MHNLHVLNKNVSPRTNFRKGLQPLAINRFLKRDAVLYDRYKNMIVTMVLEMANLEEAQ